MDLRKFESEISEKNQILIIKNKLEKAKKEFNPVFTDFLNPGEQEYIKELCYYEKLNCDLFGGFCDCERKVAAICKDGVSDNYTYPLDVISIKGNSKYEKIGFSDYLGSIMSLGLKREKIGDINIFDDCIQLWVLDDVTNYVISNLFKVKHMKVECSVIDIKEARGRIQSFKEIKINSASMRLDTVLSSLLNISRSNTSSMVKNKMVKVNFVVCDNITFQVKKDDVISIAHFGRYIVSDMMGMTKNGNQKLLIKKYI